MPDERPAQPAAPVPGIAHELNNILAVIRVNLALARRELGAQHAAEESLAEIEAACGRVAALVQALRGGEAPACAAAPALPAEPAPRHILFVDDDEALVFLARRLLLRMGHQVSTCTRPEQALAAVRADPQGFELVVTDVNLLGYSGFELARELLALRADLPLVLVSGYVDDALRAKAKEIGPLELLNKPTTVEEFAQLIHQRALQPTRTNAHFK